MEPDKCPNCQGAKLEKSGDGYLNCLDEKCGISFKLKAGEPKPAPKSKLDEHEERIKRLEGGGKEKNKTDDRFIL